MNSDQHDTGTRATNITHQYDDGEMQPHDPNCTIEWEQLVEQLAGGFTFWLTVVDGGRPPPCEVFRIEPDTVHAVGASEPFIGRSTRWDLERPEGEV